MIATGLDVADHAPPRSTIARRSGAQRAGGILPEAEALRARFDPDLPAARTVEMRNQRCVGTRKHGQYPVLFWVVPAKAGTHNHRSGI